MSETSKVDKKPEMTAAEQAIVDIFGQKLGDFPGNSEVMSTRDSVVEQFKRVGIPSRKREYWHYTDLRTLLKTIDLLSLPLGEYDIAALAYSIEREDLRFGGGRQDQYAAAFGGFNFMEFFSDNVVVVNPLRIKQKFINELQLQTILCFTGVSRESAKIIEEQTDNVKKGDSKSIEAMLKLKATAVEMKNAILHGDIAAVSAALCSGWTSKKAMSNSITNTLIDNAVSDALNAGATAGKVSGAGGGGFIMLLVPLEYRRNVLSVLCEKHFRTETIQFTSEGVVTWHV